MTLERSGLVEYLAAAREYPPWVKWVERYMCLMPGCKHGRYVWRNKHKRRGIGHWKFVRCSDCGWTTPHQKVSDEEVGEGLDDRDPEEYT